jgi:quaternary ammonium compound-resistance protein SugE
MGRLSFRKDGSARLNRHLSHLKEPTVPSLGNVTTAWICLLLAGILEIGWAVGMKYSAGFTRLGPSIATILAMLASFALLGIAVRTLPLGTAYAVWTGIGAVGTLAAGIALFGEPYNLARLLCAGMIVAGILGLKVLTAE